MGLTGIALILVQVISKIFGFIRELVLSNYYGASNISDAYLIANSIPGQLFAIVSAGITVSFIPLYNRILEKNNQIEADRFTTNLINITIIFSIILCIIVGVFALPIVRLFALGFDAQTLDIAVILTRITIFSIVFYGITSVIVPYLNVHRSFIIASMIGIPLSVGMISGIVISKSHGLIFLGIGTVLAYFFQTLLLIPRIKKLGYQHLKLIDFGDANIKTMTILSAPMIIGASANRLNFLVDRTLASLIDVGAVSAMNYADRLNGFVQGLFIIPIITLLYPMISRFVVEKNYSNLSEALNKSLSVVSLLVLPVIIGGFILSRDITSVLFLRGEFDIRALDMTEIAVKFYLLGNIGLAYREVYSRVYFSFNDTKTPVKNTIIATIMNIILNIILSRVMGLGGLALATSISFTLSALLLAKDLKIYLPKYNYIGKSIKNILKIFFSSILMGIALLIYRRLFYLEISIINLVLQILFGALVFTCCIAVLKIDEYEEGIKILRSFLKKG